MLVTLNKIGEVHFRLLDTNGYRVKAKITGASSLCRQDVAINMKDCVEKLIALESVPHMQQGYFSLYNQSNH